jgi:glycosyltransferase involved in cell wall biosynthesis
LNLAPPGKGGIERLLVSFFESMHGAEFEVSMCILDGESETGRRLRDRGCKIWTMHRRSDRLDRGLYPRLAGLLRDCRPDVIHMHGPACLAFGVPTARWAGIRHLVYTSHSSQSSPFSWRQACLAGLMRLVRGRVAVSAAAKDLFTQNYRVSPRTVEVIYNGVDCARFRPSPEPAPAITNVTVGFCGVFRSEKRLPLLIEAFASLHGRGLASRLLLVGDGPVMSECRQLVQRLGLGEAVVFAGEQTDVRPFLEQMDLVVLPSSREAMPVAVLEAMALAKTVVACAVGGIPEIIDDGISGSLLRSGEVGEWSDALARLAADPDLRRRLGDGARHRVEEHFSLQRMMAQYARLYRDLVWPGAKRSANQAAVSVR